MVVLTTTVLPCRWWSTAAATLEVVRRFTWTLLRIEAEHVTNVGKTRAFDDVPLPTLERLRLASVQQVDSNDYCENDALNGFVLSSTFDVVHSTDGMQFGTAVRKKSSAKRRIGGNIRRGQSFLLRADLMAQTTVAH